jgi:hypothetical protein
MQSIFGYHILRHICKAHKPTLQSQSMQKSLKPSLHQLQFSNLAVEQNINKTNSTEQPSPPTTQ